MKNYVVALILTVSWVPAMAAGGGGAGNGEDQAVVVTPIATGGGEAGSIESAKIEAKAAAKSEAEIPVVLDKAAAASEGGGTLFRVLFGFAVLGLLAVGAYVFLRKYSRPGQMKNAPQIKVLTQHYLGPKKSLAIVRVAGESILIGVTDDNINMIKSLSLLDEDVPEETPNRFDQVMGGLGIGNTEEIEDRVNVSAAGKGAVDEDDFVLGGIRDVVTRRLKGLKEF